VRFGIDRQKWEAVSSFVSFGFNGEDWEDVERVVPRNGFYRNGEDVEFRVGICSYGNVQATSSSDQSLNLCLANSTPVLSISTGLLCNHTGLSEVLLLFPIGETY
jgi:hypothetical protein